MNAAIISICIVTLLTLLTWLSCAVAKKHGGPGGNGPVRTAGFTDEISDDERRAYDAAVMDEMTWRDAQ
jgi:hypothetical protein